MSVHPMAGHRATAEMLISPEQLEKDYYEIEPDLSQPAGQVAFGTSGHRGNPSLGSFNEAHILAITQAICEYRAAQGHDGPLLMGKDTHAASGPAQRTALEVLAANDVSVRLQVDDGVTPTPVISHGILCHNASGDAGIADGIVITPSHNPPGDGGFKYNTPNGGPAETDVTATIQARANEILARGNVDVRRIPYKRAIAAATTTQTDLAADYIAQLPDVVDLDAIRSAGLKLGADPLGGASVAMWGRIAEAHRLDLDVVQPLIDPTFAFMCVDHDGKIRMDCSSPYAMAGLVELKDSYDLAFGNDPDADRHGIVTRSVGLMNPNHYLAVAIHYLFGGARPEWPASAAVGKTLVSSIIIDHVAASLDRKVVEVPVGFKWFVDGLFDGSLGFGGEESAGASFLRMDGRVWSTDKDGIILDLLAAEITAKTGRDPGEHYADLEARFGKAYYRRVDSPATRRQKAVLKSLSPEAVTAETMGGDPIVAKMTNAPGNGAPIGGLKVATATGWFAARPSGTEDIFKIYAESLRDEAHLDTMLGEAKEIVAAALGD